MTLFVTAGGASAEIPDALRTVAEKTGYRQTGRMDEVERLCKAYAAHWPNFLRCVEFGRSPEGRPVLALIATRTGALTPSQARDQAIPVALIQGGIHSGEIDGKDAGFEVLRTMLDAPSGSSVLDHETLVFVPVFSVDGHERFGRWNRPNQIGPEEMGWRTTAQNLNLNRDYTKADAPEMQAMLVLLNSWDPILYADLHVTDGAKFQHDISLQVEPYFSGDPALAEAGRVFSGHLQQYMAAHGSMPLDFYPEFETQDDPSSGFAQVPSLPRFSTGYWALSNRFAVLVETHSWKDYPTRVRITRHAIEALTLEVAQNGRSWRELAKAADERSRALGGGQLALDFRPGERVRTIDFQGYAYSREPSAISGALWTRYDDKTPQVWHVPMKDDPQASLIVEVPKVGYLVPAAYADEIGRRLAVHGIRFKRLDHPLAHLAIEHFRSTEAHFSPTSFEGRTAVTLHGQWHKENADYVAGALWVPIDQPKARLIVTLLDPLGPDSYSSWGFFNATLEQKEYMEPYVAEQVARDMLARDPALQVEFTQRLATEPDFEKDPAARLQFFYKRHPSWDDQFHLYPIARLQDSSALD